MREGADGWVCAVKFGFIDVPEAGHAVSLGKHSYTAVRMNLFVLLRAAAEPSLGIGNGFTIGGGVGRTVYYNKRRKLDARTAGESGSLDGTWWGGACGKNGSL